MIVDKHITLSSDCLVTLKKFSKKYFSKGYRFQTSTLDGKFFSYHLLKRTVILSRFGTIHGDDCYVSRNKYGRVAAYYRDILGILYRCSKDFEPSYEASSSVTYRFRGRRN